MRTWRTFFRLVALASALGWVIPAQGVSWCLPLHVLGFYPEPPLVDSADPFRWRKGFTNLFSAAHSHPTSGKRERALRRLLMEMWHDIRNESTTPGMELVGSDGVELEEMDSDEHGPREVRVTGLRDGNTLKATLLLPVSAHDGYPKAKGWAWRDTYDLYYETPSGARTYLAVKARSRDLVTAHEVEIPLVRGGVTTLYYDRSGSLGPHGFQAGRILKIHWDGK